MTRNTQLDTAAASIDDTDELREHAIKEAQRIKADVAGDTEALRTRRAILDRERELNGFAIERQRTEQTIGEAESKIEGLRETLRRLRDLDRDRGIFERLPEGTLVSIPASEREAYEERLQTNLGEAQSRADAQQARLDAIERGEAINEIAVEWLEGDLERLAAADAGSDDAGTNEDE